MKIIPIQEAYQKRIRSDAKVDPARLIHGLTVWLDTGEKDGEGRMKRRRGYYDGPSKGCVAEQDFVSLREERAEANRCRKPYNKTIMRSPRRDSFSATSFVRTPAIAEDEREPDTGPRPSRSMVGHRPHQGDRSFTGGFLQGAVA